jgi:hypothetical protein
MKQNSENQEDYIEAEKEYVDFIKSDEKSIKLKKAKKREKTKRIERATVGEKTTPVERAKAVEKPTGVERANKGEKPPRHERAITSEKTTSGERANKDEKTIHGERLPETVRQSLSILTRAYYDYQRERIGLDGRIGRKKSGENKKGVPARDEILLLSLMERRETCAEMELQIAKDIGKEIKVHPLWKYFLKDVKGCGESMAAVILTEFDINKAPTVSNLWSFAGLAPGKDKKRKGEKCPFNQFLRAKLCGVLGSSFLKCNSPYREYYDNMKHRLESENWGTESKNPTDKKRPKAGHQHKAATRYMIKMFLRDLYVAWRTLEGLPIRPPYEEEYLNKKHA